MWCVVSQQHTLSGVLVSGALKLLDHLKKKRKTKPQTKQPFGTLVAKRETPTTFHGHWSPFSLVPFGNMAKPTIQEWLWDSCHQEKFLESLVWVCQVLPHSYLTTAWAFARLWQAFHYPCFPSGTIPLHFEHCHIIYKMTLKCFYHQHWANRTVQRSPSHICIKCVIIITTQEKTPKNDGLEIFVWSNFYLFIFLNLVKDSFLLLQQNRWGKNMVSFLTLGGFGCLLVVVISSQPFKQSSLSLYFISCNNCLTAYPIIFCHYENFSFILTT